jgi:hypothetical protein
MTSTIMNLCQRQSYMTTITGHDVLGKYLLLKMMYVGWVLPTMQR